MENLNDGILYSSFGLCGHREVNFAFFKILLYIFSNKNVFNSGNLTQGLMLARQELYHLSLASSPALSVFQMARNVAVVTECLPSNLEDEF
jgi:hypothetical protein